MILRPSSVANENQQATNRFRVRKFALSDPLIRIYCNIYTCSTQQLKLTRTDNVLPVPSHSAKQSLGNLTQITQILIMYLVQAYRSRTEAWHKSLVQYEFLQLGYSMAADTIDSEIYGRSI